MACARACARARTRTRTHTHALVLVHVWTQALAWRILIPGEVWSVKQGWRNAAFWSRKWNAPPSISATVAAAVAAARLWCAKWTSPPLCRLFLPWLSTHPSRETSKKRGKKITGFFFFFLNTFSFLLAARPNGKTNERIVIWNEKNLIKGAAADEIRGGFYVDQLVIPESQLLSSVTFNALWIGVFNHRCWISDIGFERRHYQRHDISSAWVPGLDDLKMRFCLLLGFYLGRIQAVRSLSAA